MASAVHRPEDVEATGWTEAEALRDLAGLLRTWNVEAVERAADYVNTSRRAARLSFVSNVFGHHS